MGSSAEQADAKLGVIDRSPAHRVGRRDRDDPGLKPRIGEATARAYRRARIEAARETGREKNKFPDACPDSWDDIVGRDISLSGGSTR